MFLFSEEQSNKYKKVQQEQAQMEPHMNGCTVLCEIKERLQRNHLGVN